MSQLKSEAPRKRRQFTEEFKQDAVRLVVNDKYTFAAAAKGVGVGKQSLRKWHARLVPPPVPCGEDASQDELREEIKRLRRELRRAELEREILKKATAYFAKEVASEGAFIKVASQAAAEEYGLFRQQSRQGVSACLYRARRVRNQVAEICFFGVFPL